MSQLVTPYGTFNLIQYETELEFERAVVAHVTDIFGERRIYLDCKRRIGAKDGKQSVPDAYLIDVSSPRDPQLYVVENEISSHDLFKHIGVQLLQFSVSFSQAGRTIKQILFDEVCAEPARRYGASSMLRKAVSEISITFWNLWFWTRNFVPS